MNDPTQAQFNGALPPEYQEQLDNYKRKQLIAARLMTQNQLQMPVQGAVASKVNPWAALASVGGQGIAQYVDQDAQTGARQVQKKYAEDEAADLAALQNTAPDLQVQAGRNSKFARSRQLAETLAKNQEKLREQRGAVFKEINQPDQAIAAYEGRDFTAPGLAKPPEQPTFATQGDSLYALTHNPKRQPIVNWAPKPSNVTNTIDAKQQGRQEEMVLERMGKTLDERRKGADASKGSIDSINFALDALEKGATPGGFEDLKTTIRQQMRDTFGYEPTGDISNNTQLEMALFSNVLNQLQKVKPVSDSDMKALMKMGGSIGTDPQALTKSLAFAQSVAMKDLKGYNDYAEENKKSIHPLVQGLFSGATSGYELPKQLYGPQAYQMEVVRQLQRAGYDISGLADPDGKPFAPNSQFHINPTVGMPGVEKRQKEQASAGVRPSKSAGKVLQPDQLTPAQKAEYEAKLRGGQ